MSQYARHAPRGVLTVSGPPDPPPPDPTPPPAPDTDYLATFFANRKGYGAQVTAGIDSTYTVITVTSTSVTNTAGSLMAALAVTGKTIIRFAAGLGNIKDAGGSRPTFKMNDDTLLDGHGWTGAIYGQIDASNTRNVVLMFLTITQPFVYGSSVDGPCLGISNCQMGYVYHCTLYDSGDVLLTGGAYQLTPGHLTDKPAPYAYTVDSCRLGPNPGEYAIMSPILGTANGLVPGALNGRNNDARNGKGLECAYDHNWIEGDLKTRNVTFTSTTAFTVNGTSTITSGDEGKNVIQGADIVHPGTNIPAGTTLHYVDATHGTLVGGTFSGTLNNSLVIGYYTASTAHPGDFASFDHAVYVTEINNVIQGVIMRNGKSRSQTVDFVNNIVAKYGTPYDVSSTGETSVVYGGGTSVHDNGTLNVEGNVYIKYNNGEQFVGFQNAVADANGKPHIIVSDPGAMALTTDGSAPQDGDRRARWNWISGTIETPADTTGFDRTVNPRAGITGYTLTIPDRSVLANAQSLVSSLEDSNTSSRAGNPYSSAQPPSWRDVHTGTTFPTVASGGYGVTPYGTGPYGG